MGPICEGVHVYFPYWESVAKVKTINDGKFELEWISKSYNFLAMIPEPFITDELTLWPNALKSASLAALKTFAETDWNEKLSLWSVFQKAVDAEREVDVQEKEVTDLCADIREMMRSTGNGETNSVSESDTSDMPLVGDLPKWRPVEPLPVAEPTPPTGPLAKGELKSKHVRRFRVPIIVGGQV